MAKSRKQVVFGLLGPALDQGRGNRRWEKWRPTVSLVSHDDLLVDRFELLIQNSYRSLAETVRRDMALVSPETEVRLREVEFADPWDFEEVYGALHDFARGYDFSGREDYLVHITTGTHVAQICLFLLTEARYLPARLVQTSPPRRGHDAGEYRVIDLDLSRYDALASRFKQERRASIEVLKQGINTRNKQFNDLMSEIERVAIHSTAPILLTGPTGAGKSQLARNIYSLRRSRRLATGDFVEVNCATLRGDGAMSTLFGHARGAFTGAVRERKGLLREADGGILFLDEIGELGSDDQAMLLRALEEKRFLPLGADREVSSDFQLIAGTNRDLGREVRAGRFREDLLARINLWTYVLPALRERPEDIEPNLEYELERFSRDEGRFVRFSREARTRFVKFARSPAGRWESNFRDLNAAVTRMATLAPGGRITESVVQQEIARLERAWLPDDAGSEFSAREPGDESDPLLPEGLDLFDRYQLEGVLRVCRRSASLSDAGRRLFARSRERRRSANDADRLRKYLAKFDLRWEDLRE